jgi:hypothetical protein
MNMKCVCGHEHIDEQDPDVVYNEEFIPLRTLNDGPVIFLRKGKGHRWDDKKFQLFMCPMCGTIRGERYFG